jgi:succinyl-diaminopimelate desuccinylase
MARRIDPVELTSRLIGCRSVTPVDDGAMAIVAAELEAIGFAVDRFSAGGPPNGPVENLFATRGRGGPHFAFAGHVDVVPPGAGWTTDPFVATVAGDLLYGRGAVDMKGAIAAFIAAAEAVSDHGGTLSVILTGDEEGPAEHGTVALIDWMNARGIRPDNILVGEPTSETRLGDTIKIGRRGSVNLWLDVAGHQGHVAYPHRADNPITRLVRILNRAKALPLDEGNDWFEPSNLEVTDIEVGNPATNLIPGSAGARLNIRFNDEHRGADLVARLEAIAREEAPGAKLRAIISGESFLTPPGALSAMVAKAVIGVTGIEPKFSTGGGTSDARFLSKLCPTVEFGLNNATMHKLDEAVVIEDLHRLAQIYEAIIRSALPATK